jgi:hypothetical protein
MKIASNLSLERQVHAQHIMIQDLARQHEQIAVNHAQLLDMILNLQLQIQDLRSQLRVVSLAHTLPGLRSPGTVI